MITVHLKNGQALHFPDGTDRNVMRAAIAGKFPDQIETPMEDITKAVANDVNRIQQGGRPTSASNVNPNRSLDQDGDRPLLFDPRLGPSQSGNELGTEIGTSLIAPGIGPMKTAAQRTIGNMLTQGGVAALFNPENPIEHGGTAAGITGITHPIAEWLGGTNKYARIAKRIIPQLLGGSGGAYISHEAGLPPYMQLLSALVGAKGGQKLASKLMSPKGLMHPAAEKIAEHITPEHIKNFEKAKQYGVHITPAEASKDVNLISQSNRMGYTPEGASLLQKHKGIKLGQEEKALENLKNKIYKPESEDILRNKGYSQLKKQEISPKEVSKIYKAPKKWRYEEPEISEATYKNVAPKVKLVEPKKYEPEKLTLKTKGGFPVIRVPNKPPEIIIPKKELAKAPGIQIPENKIITGKNIITPPEKKIIRPPEPKEKLIYGRPKGPIEIKQEGGFWKKPKFKLTEPGKSVKTSEPQVIKEGGWRPPTQNEFNSDVIKSFQENGVPIAKKAAIRNAMNEVLSDSVWMESVKGIKKNSLYKNAKFLDKVKQKVHDSYSSAIGAGEKEKAKLIKSAEKSFIKELENAIPNYKETRGLHERYKARETLEDLTSKGKTHGKSLFEYLKDKSNKDELIKHVRNVPGAKKDIEALNDIFGRSRDINIEELANSLPRSFKEQSIQNMDDFVRQLMNAFKSGEYDRAAIELVTNEDWPKMLKELEKQTSKEAKMAKYFEYLSKVLVSSAKEKKKKD